MKRCSVCGRTYSPAELAQLESPGVMADDVEQLVLRDCPCGNTLAIEMTPDDRHDLADLQRDPDGVVAAMVERGVAPC